MNAVRGKGLAIILLIACVLAVLLAGGIASSGDKMCVKNPLSGRNSSSDVRVSRICTPVPIPSPNCPIHPDQC